MKPPSQPLIALQWDDAQSPQATAVIDANSDQELTRAHRHCPILTLGWVLKSDDDGMTVASEYLGDNEFRGITFVPRSLVRQTQAIRVVRPKKPSVPKSGTNVPKTGT